MKWYVVASLAVWASALASELTEQLLTKDYAVYKEASGINSEEDPKRPFPSDEDSLSLEQILDYDDFEDSDPESEEVHDILHSFEDESFPYRPQRFANRIKRNIIPGGGAKVLENEKKLSKNRRPALKIRNNHSPQGPNPQPDMGEAMGPQGNSNLYKLYPQLRSGQSSKMADVPVMDEQSPPKRWSKEKKNEIADYAMKHGIDEAVSYYRNKLNRKLKRRTVEKFIKRYQKKKEKKDKKKKKDRV